MHLVCFSQEESSEEHSLSRTSITGHFLESDSDELFQYYMDNFCNGTAFVRIITLYMIVSMFCIIMRRSG